jgi:hypothetical protein
MDFKLGYLFTKTSVDFGKPLNVGRFHKGWMEEAGFVDVEEKAVKVCSALLAIPLIGIFVYDYRTARPMGYGRQLKELGRYERWHMNQSVEAHSMALYTRVLGYSTDDSNFFLHASAMSSTIEICIYILCIDLYTEENRM